MADKSGTNYFRGGHRCTNPLMPEYTYDNRRKAVLFSSHIDSKSELKPNKIGRINGQSNDSRPRRFVKEWFGLRTDDIDGAQVKPCYQSPLLAVNTSNVCFYIF